MSTSRGNVVDPWQVIDRTDNSDALPLVSAHGSAALGRVPVSTETVGDSVRQFLLTLWNTYSFFVLYANAEGLEAEDESFVVRRSSFETDLDRWAVSRLQGVTRTVIERMDDFDCTAAGREIADYVDQLSNWYVRLNRRRFWDGDQAAFTTLRHCLVELAKAARPVRPVRHGGDLRQPHGRPRLGPPPGPPRARRGAGGR